MNHFGGTMKHLMTVLALAVAACASSAYAADDAASAPMAKKHHAYKLTAEENRLNDCAGLAESKPRDSRPDYIKACMSGAPTGDEKASGPRTKAHRVRTLTPAESKMAECAADASDMSYDERVAFVKKCVAGESTASAAAPKGKAQRVKTLSPEEQKNSDCAAKAADKPRDDRVAFVRECMGQ
jgi:hypothetical protein